MSSEILAILEYMEKEKGISREDMIAVISAAIQHAAQKGVLAGRELEVEINPRTGALKAWTLLKVVDSVSDPVREIHIEKAGMQVKDPRLGDFIKREIDPAYLGRIAAQTARQAIMQRMRQFEKERIYDDYKDQIGEIISGVVRRRERGDLIVDLGKAEALFPKRERIPGEDYAPGERIRCLLLAIENTARGPEIILSRASMKFMRRLFELEITEIADGTVSIEGIAREPGYRTKIIVKSNDPNVDPVGACVGARGARVKSIVRELGGEKVDVIRYWSDPRKMLEEAIKPVIPKNLEIDLRNKRVYFEVSEMDLAVAIGKRGQNAKLTSRLLGWRIDINKEQKRNLNFDERIQKAVAGIGHIPGISDETAQLLVDNGFTSAEVFEGVTPSDLMSLGFGENEARNIIEKVSEFRDATSS